MQSICYSLSLETLKDILHVVPLSLKPGPVVVCHIQLPQQVADVVLKEGLQVAPDTFLFLKEVPLGL